MRRSGPPVYNGSKMHPASLPLRETGHPARAVPGGVLGVLRVLVFASLLRIDLLHGIRRILRDGAPPGTPASDRGAGRGAPAALRHNRGRAARNAAVPGGPVTSSHTGPPPGSTTSSKRRNGQQRRSASITAATATKNSLDGAKRQRAPSGSDSALCARATIPGSRVSRRQVSSAGLSVQATGRSAIGHSLTPVLARFQVSPPRRPSTGGTGPSAPALHRAHHAGTAGHFLAR